jgi:hypothetical protein
MLVSQMKISLHIPKHTDVEKIKVFLKKEISEAALCKKSKFRGFFPCPRA